jgi:hypothetical protein
VSAYERITPARPLSGLPNAVMLEFWFPSASIVYEFALLHARAPLAPVPLPSESIVMYPGLSSTGWTTMLAWPDAVNALHPVGSSSSRLIGESKP